jgi:hypothetical protein
MQLQDHATHFVLDAFDGADSGRRQPGISISNEPRASDSASILAGWGYVRLSGSCEALLAPAQGRG